MRNMGSILILIGCLLIAGALTLVFFLCLAVATWQTCGRQKRAQKAAQDRALGRLLSLQHPEWRN